VNVVRHQMPFQDPAFLLLGQLSEHLTQMRSQLLL
jgi:hypothetical protein